MHTANQKLQKINIKEFGSGSLPLAVAEMFFNNALFREFFLSKIPPEEMAKAEKIAKEQNTTTIEVVKKKFAEILKEDKKPQE
jgi:hypothetical protein